MELNPRRCDGGYMGYEYDPLPEAEDDRYPPDCPEEAGLITTDDFYDLLMEQQEQM